MLEQYHKKVSPEKTNLPTVEALHHWRAGEPIPKYAPNPHEALRRHAEAHERATSNVRQLTARPRHTSPTGEKGRAAA